MNTDHTPQPGNDVHELRRQLFATIRGVRDKTIDIDQARAINDIGKTLTDLAKVEVDAMRVTGETKSEFLTAQDERKPAEPLPDGITGVTRHLLKG